MVLGSLALKAFGAITAISLARILGPEHFGEYGIIQSTVLMFATYGSLRMGNTAVKYVAQYRVTDPARAARILKLSLTVPLVTLGVISAIIVVMSPGLARHLLGRPELASGLVLGALYLFFLTYGSLLQQALTGFEDFKSGAKNQSLRAVLACGLCIPMGWRWGGQGALLGLVVASACVLPQALAQIRRNRREYGFATRVSLRESLVEWPVLWGFALPGFLVIGIMSGANWIGRLLLTRNGSFTELGLFEAAGQWSIIVCFLPGVIARVFMPVLSAKDGVGDVSAFHKTFSVQVETVVLITGPLIVLILGLTEFLAMTYGAGFEGVEKIMPLLFIAGLMRTLNQSFRIAYESKGRQWNSFAVYLVWAGILLSSSFYLVARQGASGLAISFLFAEIGLLVVSGIQVQYFLLPGVLSRHGTLFLRMVGFILVAYLLQANLTSTWSAPACLMLSIAAAFPLLRRIVDSRLHEDLAAKFKRKLGKATPP